MLLRRLKLPSIEFIVQDSRLRWYGHVQRSDGWINKVTTLPIEGDTPQGRPKKTWAQTVKSDRKLWGMTNVDPMDRDAWRLAQAKRKRGTIAPAE